MKYYKLNAHAHVFYYLLTLLHFLVILAVVVSAWKNCILTAESDLEGMLAQKSNLHRYNKHIRRISHAVSIIEDDG